MEIFTVQKLDDERLKVFLEGLRQGLSIPEACIEAGIFPEEYAAHCAAIEGFDKVCERLQQHPVIKSKKSLFKGLDDPDRALKYLERKVPDEFAPQQIQKLSTPKGESLIVEIVSYASHNGTSNNS